MCLSVNWMAVCHQLMLANQSSYMLPDSKRLCPMHFEANHKIYPREYHPTEQCSLLVWRMFLNKAVPIDIRDILEVITDAITNCCTVDLNSTPKVAKIGELFITFIQLQCTCTAVYSYHVNSLGLGEIHCSKC